MLCSSKLHRPDKLLHKRLITLVYSLIALTIALILFLLYPDYRLLLVFSFILITVFCLTMTFKTINAAEEAISYGGFANELMKNDFEILRIDNSKLEPVIQNDLAQDFFKDTPVINFLEQHLANTAINQSAFARLKSALLNLSNDTVTLNLNIYHDDNTVFTPESYFEVSVRPIYLKKTDIFTGRFSIKAIKKSCYILWSLKDISARHNMEQIFQDERKSLHDFLDYLPVGLYTCRSDYYIEYCNHTFANMLGISREELISHNLRDILAPQTSLPPQQSHWYGNLYFKNSNQQICEFFTTQESFRDDKDIKFHCVTLNNIPNDANLKQDLDKSLDKINWLFNNAPVGIGFINKQSIILDCNMNIISYFATAKENIIRHNLLDFITAEDQSAFSDTLKKFEETYENQSIEIHIKSENADKIATIYLQPMQSLHTNDTTQEGFVFYLIDSTQHKKLELQYAQAQKMQAMGQLAGGVAHDFNNLLTAMIGFCDLLLQRHGIGDPSFSDLMQIKQNANRAAGLVRQLLAFSRKQPLKPKLIDVTENFVELSQLLKRALGEKITLKFNHSNDLGFVRVDPVQFSQVFLNLAVNAKDAMNGSGTLTITTRVENLTQPYQFGADTIKPGEFVVIDVQDTGCGIPIENLNRIFEPFFSTKQNIVGSGTGLGLSMVYGIVRQTEGFIKVKSIVGKGTTFSIHLPRFETNTEEENIAIPTKEVITDRDGTPILTVQEKTSSPVNLNQKLIFGLNVSALDRPSNNTQAGNPDIRILFVEDEDSVRTFAVRALKKKGYDVISCNSAENALERLDTDTKFNLLITDMVMPGMSGAELAEIVHKRIPDIKIILASGYSEEIARRELAASQEFEFMAKPFSLGDLTQKVFNVLNQK